MWENGPSELNSEQRPIPLLRARSFGPWSFGAVVSVSICAHTHVGGPNFPMLQRDLGATWANVGPNRPRMGPTPSQHDLCVCTCCKERPGHFGPTWADMVGPLAPYRTMGPLLCHMLRGCVFGPVLGRFWPTRPGQSWANAGAHVRLRTEEAHRPYTAGAMFDQIDEARKADPTLTENGAYV